MMDICEDDFMESSDLQNIVAGKDLKINIMGVYTATDRSQWADVETRSFNIPAVSIVHKEITYLHDQKGRKKQSIETSGTYFKKGKDDAAHRDAAMLNWI
jgi:hypothetical protein